MHGSHIQVITHQVVVSVIDRLSCRSLHEIYPRCLRRHFRRCAPSESLHLPVLPQCGHFGRDFRVAMAEPGVVSLLVKPVCARRELCEASSCLLRPKVSRRGRQSV